MMTKTYLKYGAIIAASLIFYFLLMKLLGLHESPAFSIFNAVLYGGGILRAMQTDKKRNPNFNYASGWQAGFWSGTVATLIFTVFMAFYMFQINTTFAEAILASWPVQYANGVVVMLISIVLMGMSTAIVLSLTFMQLLKESMNPKSVNA